MHHPLQCPDRLVLPVSADHREPLGAVHQRGAARLRRALRQSARPGEARVPQGAGALLPGDPGCARHLRLQGVTVSRQTGLGEWLPPEPVCEASGYGSWHGGWFGDISRPSMANLCMVTTHISARSYLIKILDICF